jgi:hypothetical protein
MVVTDKDVSFYTAYTRSGQMSLPRQAAPFGHDVDAHRQDGDTSHCRSACIPTPPGLAAPASAGVCPRRSTSACSVRTESRRGERTAQRLPRTTGCPMRCMALACTHRARAARALLAPEPDNGGLSGLAGRHLDERKAFAAARIAVGDDMNGVPPGHRTQRASGDHRLWRSSPAWPHRYSRRVPWGDVTNDRQVI